MISFLGDSALPSVGESFALRGDLLLPIAAKVGKNARRNLRFLHFWTRYGLYKSKLPAARSQKMSCFVSSLNRLCFCAAAADAYAEQRFSVYR